MAKITITNPTGGYNLAQINANMTSIVSDLNNRVLYRDNPAGEPNEMHNSLDMNANRILNLPQPSALTEPVRLKELQDFTAGTTSSSLIAFTPVGTIAATNVQAAIVEVDADAKAREAVVIDRALYRTNPDGKPNTMLIPLDMGTQRINNLAAPIANNDAARLIDVVNATSGNTPANLSAFSPYQYAVSTNVQGAIQNVIDGVASNLGSTRLGYNINATGSVTRTQQNKYLETISVKDFGAVADGVTNDSAAFQAALNYASTHGGGRIYIPAGTYVLGTALTYTHPSNKAGLTIEGDGEGATFLDYTSTGNMLTINFISQYNIVHIMGFTATTNGVGTANCIVLNQTFAIPDPANTSGSTLSNLMIRGKLGLGQDNTSQYWATGIDCNGVSNINLFTVFICGAHNASYPTTGTAVNFHGTLADIPVVLNAFGCTFNLMGTGISYGNYTQGMTVANCNFTGCFNGIGCPPPGVGLFQLAVTSSQFNCQNGLVAPNGVYMAGVLWMNNLHLLPTNGTGINLASTHFTSLIGNQFVTANGLPTSGLTGIYMNDMHPAASAVITGNIFWGMSSSAIRLDTTSARVNVQSNSYLSNAINVNNSGAGNIIGGGSI